MSRLRRIETTDRYFFITICLIRHLSPLTPSERDVCVTRLAHLRLKHAFSLFAYTIMPDHAHLLLWAGDVFLPRLMQDWKSATGFEIAKLRGRIGPLWQKRYFDFILRRASDFTHKLEYIHNNPVAKGLVERPEDWRWSSAASYSGKSQSPLQPDIFQIPSDPNTPLWPIP